jgi:hypothetical protein
VKLSQLTPDILKFGSTHTLEKFRHVTCAVIAHIERYGDEIGEIEEQREMVRRLEAELRRRDPTWNQYRNTN